MKKMIILFALLTGCGGSLPPPSHADLVRAARMVCAAVEGMTEGDNATDRP